MTGLGYLHEHPKLAARYSIPLKEIEDKENEGVVECVNGLNYNGSEIYTDDIAIVCVALIIVSFRISG